MKRITLLGIFIAIIFTFLFTSCNQINKVKMEKTKGITKSSFGKAGGKEVFLYTLINSKGTEVKITNFGGIVTSWISADKNNKRSSIVLGYDSLSGYLAAHPYFGAIVGRYGNRIAKGKFSIDSVEYTLAINNGPNHLHGGVVGFDKVVWEPTVENDSVPSLLLSYLSKDGEEGYPGNLNVDVHYTLTDEDELKIEYTATTDKKTVVNLTNHSYFNLTGDVANTILDHELQIDADHFTSVDSTLIPTGEITSVKGTPFDFTQPTKVGLRIDSVKGGYDHNYVFNKLDASLTKVASVSEQKSGRVLEVFTTEPGVQFYTGNFLDGTLKTSDGKAIQQHAALCLETQHFPDSPNEPNFPTTILLTGQKFHSITVYKLSVNK
ncbi:MAG: galactose mutarotase [Chitinophagia bacterium]|nr:galactose mutarotase [Chitinophagia bacterium]